MTCSQLSWCGWGIVGTSTAERSRCRPGWDAGNERDGLSVNGFDLSRVAVWEIAPVPVFPGLPPVPPTVPSQLITGGQPSAAFAVLATVSPIRTSVRTRSG